MLHLRNLWIVIVLLPLLFGACVNLKQSSHKVNQYTLEYDPPRVTDLRTLPVVIRVEPFATAAQYNSLGMVYRDEKFRRESYTYHKWRSSPGDLVSHFLVRDMRQSNAFHAVLLQETTATCTHVLEGSVDEFFEWSRGDDSQGVLSVSVTLIAQNEPSITDRILYQHTYRVSTSCQANDPAALAKALSQSLAGISEQIIRDIHAHLVAPEQ